MITIHKHTLYALPVQPVEMRRGAELLTVQSQMVDGKELLKLWVRVDTDEPMARRKVAVVMTGAHAPDDWMYVGTAQLLNGTIVAHVFDGGEVSATD